MSKSELSILVPIDFSRGTEKWIAQGLVNLANVRKIQLLYIVPLSMSEVSEFISEDVVENGRKVAEGKMNDLVKSIESAGSFEIGYEIAVGDPARVILDQAETGRFDMIMMGHRGFEYIEDFFIGSVTLKVISKSPIPVLVVRKTHI
ncbi:MAG: universal stress protein [Nitrososphaeria archaeon]